MCILCIYVYAYLGKFSCGVAKFVKACACAINVYVRSFTLTIALSHNSLTVR